MFIHTINNKPENQDEDALGKIEQQQDFVILNLILWVLDNDWELLKITKVFMHKHFKNVFRHLEIVLRYLANVLTPESQKPRQRVSVANRKVFARPESFCAVDI